MTNISLFALAAKDHGDRSVLTPSSVAYIFCTHLTLAPSYLPHLYFPFVFISYFKNLQILFEINRINKVEQKENSGERGREGQKGWDGKQGRDQLTTDIKSKRKPQPQNQLLVCINYIPKGTALSARLLAI